MGVVKITEVGIDENPTKNIRLYIETGGEFRRVPLDAILVLSIDKTLSIPGAAADAAEMGEQIGEIKDDLHKLQEESVTADRIEQAVMDYFAENPAHDGGLNEALLKAYLSQRGYATKDYVAAEIGKVDATTIVVNGIDLEIDDDGNITVISAPDGNEVAY